MSPHQHVDAIGLGIEVAPQRWYQRFRLLQQRFGLRDVPVRRNAVITSLSDESQRVLRNLDGFRGSDESRLVPSHLKVGVGEFGRDADARSQLRGLRRLRFGFGGTPLPAVVRQRDRFPIRPDRQAYSLVGSVNSRARRPRRPCPAHPLAIDAGPSSTPKNRASGEAARSPPARSISLVKREHPRRQRSKFASNARSMSPVRTGSSKPVHHDSKRTLCVGNSYGKFLAL